MKRVVISQPMFFPWVGMFEQTRLADVHVHYDDVQFSKGSFTNRVQIKTPRGSEWLSVPLRNLRLGQKIREVAVDDRQDWRHRHLQILSEAYAEAPFFDEMLTLAKAVYARPTATLCEIAIASMEAVWGYFPSARPRKVLRSSDMGIGGQSSRRVLDVVKQASGTHYITGHGARQYLDHALFEADGVRVEYLNYQKQSYPQLHGEFTPFVSVLDLIANLGKEGARVMVSGTVDWKEFII